MSEIVVSVENLSKRYLVGHHLAERAGATTLRDAFERGARNLVRKSLDLFHGRGIVQGDEVEEFWALRNVNFAVNQGDVVGIIGRNGAGKSTLLKILSRITTPTSGSVCIKGRVASLLEVGTGFHPELSGRENIFLNGAILGMNTSEIKARFDEIVDFAGVEKFIDTPVKRYSSGMHARLAFAVAAHLDPMILIVDEVLAVGDTEFQKRCLGKMREITQTGERTVLFVSHNMPSVQQLCRTGILLVDGEIVAKGKIDDVVEVYLPKLDPAARNKLRERKDRQGNGRLRVVEVTFHNDAGARVDVALLGKPIRIRIHYESEWSGAERRVHVAFNLRNADGFLLTCFWNIQTGVERLPVYAKGYFECYWPEINLRSGFYSAAVYIAVDGELCDWMQGAFDLLIEDTDIFGTGQLVARNQGDLVCEQKWVSSA